MVNQNILSIINEQYLLGMYGLMLIILFYLLMSSFFHVIFIVFENNIRQSHVRKVSYLCIRMPNSLENLRKHQKLNFVLWKVQAGRPVACLFFYVFYVFLLGGGGGGVIFTQVSVMCIVFENKHKKFSFHIPRAKVKK